MKKLLITVLMLITTVLAANADVLPYTSTNLSKNTIGMYQVPKEIYIYEKPDTSSHLVFKANWDYESFHATSGSEVDIFSVLVKQKELAFIQVVDLEDSWLKVIYNKQTNKTGWIQQEELRFMPWRNFYNIYGRKYGLYLLKDTPESVKNLHSNTTIDSQIVSKLLKPSKIKLTVTKGNWALITAYDAFDESKTGYLNWRSDSGEIFAFPAIK